MAFSKVQKFISHIAGWLLFISLPMLFLSAGAGNNLQFRAFLSINSLVFFCCYGFLFYLNTYLLMPLLYQRGQILIYIIALLILLAAVVAVQPFDRLLTSPPGREARLNRERFPGVDHEDPPGHPPPEERQDPGSWNPPPGNRPGPQQSGSSRRGIDAVSIFLFVVIIVFSFALSSARRLRETEKRVVQAEADKANAELSFLKAQINPHFLFNTLNNIYTLSVRRSENTSESILKLSNIMRYMTDEVGADFVSLEHEIACLHDYIDLQKLRLTKQTSVSFTVNGSTGQFRIPPLILMTFVENAFKYGVSNRTPSTISIALQVDQHSISFTCENNIFDRKETEARIGIGLKNTIQRLNHLYPGKHLLTTTKNDGKFVTYLTLNA